MSQCAQRIWDPTQVKTWPHMYRCPHEAVAGDILCADHSGKEYTA